MALMNGMRLEPEDDENVEGNSYRFFFSMKVNLFLKCVIYRAEECVALLSSARRKRKKYENYEKFLSTRK